MKYSLKYENVFVYIKMLKKYYQKHKDSINRHGRYQNLAEK